MKTLLNILKTTLFALISLLLLGSCTTPTQPTRITVLSYNIYHGENAKGQSNLDAVAQIINTLQPDLVALQEVDNETTRSKGLDLTSELSKRTEMEGIFGKAMDFAGGGYGEAILSRLPISATKNNLLPYTPNAEPRTALEIKVRLPNGESLLFVGTHLDHLRNPENRMMQARHIKELYQNSELPIVLAGDLNATPESEPIRLYFQEWSYASQAKPKPTFPSVQPKRKIDYIMYKPRERWRVLESRVIDEKIASDHCPVLAVLELLPNHLQNVEQERIGELTVP
jgi:endonuclease/exonuclease/phosphatase family metal-dependent hydrolase